MISNTFKYFFLLLLFIASSAVATPKVQINNMRVFHSADKTRFIFDLSGPLTQFHSFNLENPERVVLDIENANFTARPTHRDLTNSIVEDIRSGPREHDVLRIVFDLIEPAKPRIAMLQPRYPQGYQLVLDLYPVQKTPLPTQLPATTLNIKPIPKVILPLTQTARDVIVVIDPGHGGKDPGASGPHGVKEKNIVLAISRHLQKELNKRAGIKAYLTREGNYYLTLRQRLGIARKHKADLFIAIHADAFKNAHSEGATVFALSESGASSELARWIAEKENYSELGGTSLNGKDNMLRSVLIDLSQTATISASLQLGAYVLRHLDTITQLHHSRVEQARFVVLKSPDILSLLIETGFISNPYEERRLCNTNYQRQLAMAITNGITYYFSLNPPQGSFFAMRQQARKYTAERGDTLQSVAQQYQVSVAILKKINGVYSNHLNRGQIILIPTNMEN